MRSPSRSDTLRQRAFAAVGEAVWWVAIVDGTLVRHHPEAYDCVMAAQAPAERLPMLREVKAVRAPQPLGRDLALVVSANGDDHVWPCSALSGCRAMTRSALPNRCSSRHDPP